MHAPQRLLVSVEPDEDSLRTIDAMPMQELRGNIDMVCDSQYLRIGPFAGAVILLPTVAEIAKVVLKLRRGDTSIEAQVIGDSPSIWFVARKAGADIGVAIAHRNAEIGILSRDDVDAAFECGVEDFIRALHARRSASSWGLVGQEMMTSIEACWPNLLHRAGAEDACRDVRVNGGPKGLRRP